MTERLSRLDEQLSNLEEATRAARETTLAVNEAVRRLREVKKEIRDLLRTDAKDMVEEAVDDFVMKILDIHVRSIEEQIEAATHRAFTKLMKEKDNVKANPLHDLRSQAAEDVDS